MGHQCAFVADDGGRRSVGFLGRFERWNSWDVLTRPHVIASKFANGVLDPLSHGRTLGVTLMFGTMVLVTYVMFVTASRGAFAPSDPRDTTD